MGKRMSFLLRLPNRCGNQVWMELRMVRNCSFEPSVYDCLHAFNLGWPCPSFDVMRDELGVLHRDFPNSLHCVTGTQADQPSNNAIAAVHMRNITGQRRKPKLPSAMDEDDNESESDSSSDEDEDEDEEEMAGQSDQATQSTKIYFCRCG